VEERGDGREVEVWDGKGEGRGGGKNDREKDQIYQNSRHIRLHDLRLAIAAYKGFPDRVAGRSFVVEENCKERTIPARHAVRFLVAENEILKKVGFVATPLVIVADFSRRIAWSGTGSGGTVSTALFELLFVDLAAFGDGSADVDLLGELLLVLNGVQAGKKGFGIRAAGDSNGQKHSPARKQKGRKIRATANNRKTKVQSFCFRSRTAMSEEKIKDRSAEGHKE
jgi:hypothetical protein